MSNIFVGISNFHQRLKILSGFSLNMDEFPKILSGGWSWEENKLFELALAVVDEDDPDRWQVVAAMIGGKFSAEEVEKQYVILVEDLQFIESGEFDHKFFEVQPCLHLDSTHSVCRTDEDHNLLVQLDIS